MKRPGIATLLVAIQLVPAILFAQDKNAQNGADMFRQNCGACHTVGNGKLVGPDLKGVENRHPDAWLHKWIKSSQGLVTSGDKAAKKVFEDNAMIPMPDQALTDDQISVVLNYIKGETGENMAQSTPDNSATQAVVAPVAANNDPVPPNNGIDPLIMAGTPAVFDNPVDKRLDNGSSWGGNKWLVLMVIVLGIGFITTTVAWADVVKDKKDAA